MPDIMHLLTIGAPPARVFEAIATAEGVRRWWTPDADLDARLGGTGRFGFYDGKATRIEITELSPPDRIEWKVLGSFRAEWIGTTLAFDLRAAGDGTTLRFAHRGFPAPDDDYALCTTGWGIYLTRLKSVLEEDCRTP